MLEYGPDKSQVKGSISSDTLRSAFRESEIYSLPGFAFLQTFAIGDNKVQ